MEKSSFLERKYPDLPGSKPVERAVVKAKSEGKKAHTREERIDVYLDRLEDMVGKGNWVSDDRGRELLEHKILDQYVTKYEDIPQSYWQLQERIMRERGEGGDWAGASHDQKEHIKKQTAEAVLTDQRASLEQWMDYFFGSDSAYIPKDLKYWIFRNLINLQEFDKEKKEFPKRSKGTVKQFPDLNYEALGYLVDAVEKKLKGADIEFEYDIQPEDRAVFKQYLEKEDFAKLYAWASELYNPIPEHLLPVTEGTWVKYDQGSDASRLVGTIRGKGTGWCTAGENTARTQLQGGDFYVYYSLDDESQPKIPRIAIRMEGHDKIAENPRGVAYKQNLDPYMGSVLEDKLKEFGPVGEVYRRKSADMKELTEVERKTKRGETLTRADLAFLYELDRPIQGFGYQKDPRVKELRKGRNPEADMLIIFDCAREQIAHSPREINETTKAYLGKLKPRIFDLIQEYGIEHIYTSFPEGKIRREKIIIGGKTERQLEEEMQSKNVKAEYALDMMRNRDFKTLEQAETGDYVRLHVRDLLPGNLTTDQLYARADELGLDLCSAEIGPHYRLQNLDQPVGEYTYIAMKPITDRGGYPGVFSVNHDVGGLWLYSNWAGPVREWHPDFEFVFRLRK